MPTIENAVESTPASESTETAVATAPAKPAKKKAAKKAVKASAKKATAKKAEKNGAAKKSGPTIRERVFKLLAKHTDGLTGAQIMEKLELGGIPALLKDEGVCDKPRIKRQSREDVRGVVYVLTAAGRTAVEKGTVDSAAAPASKGAEWPNGR